MTKILTLVIATILIFVAGMRVGENHGNADLNHDLKFNVTDLWLAIKPADRN